MGTFFSLEAMPTDEVITWHSTPTRASSMGKLVRIQLWIGVLHWTKTCLIQFLSRFSHKLANIPPPPNTKRHWLNPHEHHLFVPEFLRISKPWIWGCFGCSQFIPQCSLLVTTHSSDSGFMDEAINYIPVFFWLSPVLCVWMSATSVTFFSKMLPKTNRGCTKPTFQFVLQLYFSCYRHIQTRPSFALEPKVF